MDFPARLKNVIEQTGLSREAFYMRVKTSKSQLFNYLGGRSEPTLSFFQSLKEEFPWVDMDWLIRGEEAVTVAEPAQPYCPDPVIQRIDTMLVGMCEEQKRDVLKYTEEKKLLSELKAEKQRKAA